jgi:hypothetical protein
MITKVLDMLAVNDFYNVSERVEIAKGKYERITSWKQAWEQIKRTAKWQKRSI